MLFEGLPARDVATDVEAVAAPAVEALGAELPRARDVDLQRGRLRGSDRDPLGATLQALGQQPLREHVVERRIGIATRHHLAGFDRLPRLEAHAVDSATP